MEIFKYYHFLNPKDYPNLGLDIYINIFYFCMFVITALVLVFLHFQRRELFRFFTALSRHEAKSEASAKTVEGLRLKNNLLLKYILKHDNRVKRLVGVVGEKKYTYEEYTELLKKKKEGKESAVTDTPAEELKYYLRTGEEEGQNRIIATYEPSVIKTILFIVLVFMIFGCLILVSPEMLELLNNWLG